MSTGLPDSINTTYVPGSTPSIQAADLNALQAATVDAWGIIRHGQCWVNEDFTGADLGQLNAFGSYWSTVFHSSASPPWTVTDDSANAASGAVTFSSASASNTLATHGTFALGQSDVYMTTRVRVPALGGGTSNVLVGLFSISGSNGLLFLNYQPSANGNSNWWLTYNTVSSPLKVDTGISAASASYQVIDVVRLSGVLTVFINGGPVATLSPTPWNLDGSIVNITASRATSGTTTCWVDYFKMWSRTAR